MKTAVHTRSKTLRLPAPLAAGIARLAAAYRVSDSDIIRRILEPAVTRAVAYLPADDAPVDILSLPAQPRQQPGEGRA